MSIASVVTRGYGRSIADVATRGYLATVASVETIRPTGGFPLSYEEWARRTRKDEDEEQDAPPKPRVIEKIGVAQPVVETKAFIPSPPIETGLSELTKSEIRRRARLAKKRRQEDEWFILQ